MTTPAKRLILRVPSPLLQLSAHCIGFAVDASRKIALRMINVSFLRAMLPAPADQLSATRITFLIFRLKPVL
jgi:hypothetical protein